jgi:hypothetical protein
MSSNAKPGRPRLRHRAGFATVRRRVQRPAGGTASQLSDYSVATDLPESLPITEIELRAVEILLGSDLKELLAGMSTKSLKYKAK